MCDCVCAPTDLCVRVCTAIALCSGWVSLEMGIVMGVREATSIVAVLASQKG